MWLHFAAIACLLWAATRRGALRDLSTWSTPFDGLVFAMLGVAGAQLLPPNGSPVAESWFWQVVGCAATYLGLTSVLRRDPDALDAAWVAFAAVAVALGLHAVWACTGGLDQLARQSALADARWAGTHALAKGLALATMLTLGRALERHSSPGWRLAALVGALGSLLHAATDGFGLGPDALAQLDEPLHFSMVCVTMLLAVRVARMGWELRRERAGQVERWRLFAVAVSGVGLASVFGGSTGGEPLRVLAAIAAATVVADRALPRANGKRAAPIDEPAPLSRAA
jgi:hypothetical protein